MTRTLGEGAVKVEVLDEPGPGGACHLYGIHWAGGSVVLPFQNGPVNEKGVNGITHEALLAVLIDRFQHFQAGPMACSENRAALVHLKQVREWLQARTRKRIERGVEGTSQL